MRKSSKHRLRRHLQLRDRHHRPHQLLRGQSQLLLHHLLSDLPGASLVSTPRQGIVVMPMVTVVLQHLPAKMDLPQVGWLVGWRRR